jgi:nucleotide-binding universal stress UspA family protein
MDIDGNVIDQLMESVEQEGKERLVRATAQAMRADVTSTAIVKWGNAPAAILETATEEECDLIVLGARPLTGWKRLRIGSVANAVVAKARQPVLVVKQASLDAPIPPPSDRILVATGGSTWSEAAMAYAIKLAQSQHLTVNALYVIRKTFHDDSLDHFIKGRQLLAEARAQAATCGVAFEGTIMTGNVPDAILTMAACTPCDLIILGSRGLTGWKRLMAGNIANAVMAKSTVPVLVVKRFDAV